MTAPNFTGLGVALVTPFKSDGSIDFDALSELIDYQINGGADFLVVLGTTAETPTLSSTEKNAIVEFVAEKVDGRVPLVLGIGGNCTAAIVGQLKSGIPTAYGAILSVCPFYNKPSQEGLRLHFTAIANASPVPVILYNVPSRTGVNMKPETTLLLASHPNIIGIKEASGIMGQADKIIASAPHNFIVLSGDDILTLPLINIGAKGVISVIANAFPKEFSKLVHSALNMEQAKAKNLHRKIAPVLPFMFCDGNPSGIKCLLKHMGKCSDTVRLPLTTVRQETDRSIKQFISSFGN